MDICEKLNIEVTRKLITKQMLGDFSAAFLTGTSPGVLPIKTLDTSLYQLKIIHYRTL